MTNPISHQAARLPGQALPGAGAAAPLPLQNPALKTIETRLERDSARLSAFGRIALALDAFRDSAGRLAGANAGTAVQVDAKVAQATLAGAAALPGLHALEVKQLAQAQQLVSKPLADKDAALGTGAPTVIRVDMGSGKGAGTALVRIGQGNNTLEGIAKAMREAGIDASLVKDGKGHALRIAGQPGAANTLRISVEGDPVLAGLLAYEGGANSAMTQQAAARDALLVVDGKTITSATNTVDKAIAGVTLNLTGTGKSDVKLVRDSAALGDNVKRLVEAFNTVNSRLDGMKTGDASQDALLGRIKSGLGAALDGVDRKALAEAGISHRNGALVLDETRLKAALAADPGKVDALLGDAETGLAARFARQAAQQLSAGGKLADSAAAVQSQVNKLNVQKAQLSELMQRQASLLAQQYTLIGKGGNPAYGPGAAPPSLFDFMA